MEPAEEPGAVQREQLVSKTHFRRVWDRLASVGVCGMRMPHAGFVAACSIKLPDLGVWYANTGKEWDSRNLLVLGNPAILKGSVRNGDRKSADWVSKHIVREPLICGGQPTIRGTRIMVGVILGMYDGGYTTDKILEGFHWITREDVEAVLEFSRVESEDGRAVVNS